MSLETFTADIKRDTPTVDAYGGETYSRATRYSGVRMCCTFPKGRVYDRNENGPSNFGGPSVRTAYSYVVFIDNFDGSNYSVSIGDVVIPNPDLAWLPDVLTVTGVRPYYDGMDGQLQLDCEDDV